MLVIVQSRSSYWKCSILIELRSGQFFQYGYDLKKQASEYKSNVQASVVLMGKVNEPKSNREEHDAL